MNELIECQVPADLSDMKFRWPDVAVTASFSAPLASDGAGEGTWRHVDREESPRVLAGVPGQLLRDTFTNDRLHVLREVWVGEGDGGIAVRHVVVNDGDRELELQELRPLHCVGPEGLTIDDRPAGQWQVLRQGSLKNEIPSAVRLGVFDEDYFHATQELGEQGDSPTDADGQAVRLKIDPFGIIRSDASESDAPGSDAEARHLLVSFLTQMDHLASIDIETDGARQQLDHMTARCLFDGCALPPGGERASRWVLLMSGADVAMLTDAYADRVARYYGISEPPAPPPAVWCSWYYYGPAFFEKELHAELDYLREHRLPFDVLLIDDSRPRPWGDWLSHPLWPSGMADAAQRIAALGYRPGIWTCPFLAKTDSQLAADHPEWLLKRDDGERVMFKMDGMSYVLDPTYPGVARFLEELFRVMTEDWGFTYHKLDFLRSVFMNPRAQFYDRSATRLDAYRRGLEAVRRGAGPSAYISVCGGHYGGSLGLADSQRSGSDVVASWDDPPALPAIKQNLMRTWMNRLWHTDADAMMVRRRATPINDTPRGRLSLGLFTDAEARSIAANQYVGGGILCATECFSDIEDDRLALYRHVVPAMRAPGIPLDPYHERCPSRMLNRIEPRCAPLGPWVTVTAFNWDEQVADQSVALTETVLAGLPGDQFVVFEFVEQRVVGIFTWGETVPLKGLAPHDCRVLRIAPWDGQTPVLAGTDLHFSGGGVEIASWHADADEVHGTVETQWSYPVTLTAAFPTPEGCEVVTATVDPADGAFRMSRAGDLVGGGRSNG